ncbi:hypothetical protein NC653_023322 [Populus alba x Populus x berolinensis]|uniref:Uncharacterized protein n=1 Tax=Populus alba x Populus x berolinensis TaxID=444605 RepID=A0AAD6MGX8_9ROSI|nr:hypothetical protein NC653_023322 [Populus alba x Populus x berolinensis]
MGDLSATWSIILAHTNQQDTVTSQLNDGIRGLTLDMYAFQNDIWLCHSFGGNCYNIAAFQPAINVLKEINSSISRSQPIRNHHHFHRGLCYITSPRGLTKVFDASGLMKYWFPVSRMPKNGGKWPTVDDTVQKNQRLVVFTSKSAKEAYVVEIQSESYYFLNLEQFTG